ncbi:Fc receptor-like A [Xenopus laevis]|uniref:Fc receptor-like A n=1 Tax=Xenopus laevis TaxID=8355 RepID=A0A8J1LIR9_XENLA|nr:Fc receptor-like A [Xenopus laevis]
MMLISLLELFSVPNITASSDPVTEGAEMSLDCVIKGSQQKGTSSGRLQFAFYRDGRVLQNFTTFSTYQVFPVQMKDSGEYSCEVRTSTNGETKMSNTVSIRIQELFSSPEIKVTPHTVTPGENLSIKCSTVSKSDTTKLRFRFYKDNVLVQNENLSNNYYVKSVQLKDSGNYSCDARINGTVKTSREIRIEVQAVFASNDTGTNSTSIEDVPQNDVHLIVLVPLILLLVVVALLIKYKHKLLAVFTTTYRSHPGPATDLLVETDPYYSFIEFSSIQKDPVIQTTNTDVTYTQVKA